MTIFVHLPLFVYARARSVYARARRGFNVFKNRAPPSSCQDPIQEYSLASVDFFAC